MIFIDTILLILLMLAGFGIGIGVGVVMIGLLAAKDSDEEDKYDKNDEGGL